MQEKAHRLTRNGLLEQAKDLYRNAQSPDTRECAEKVIHDLEEQEGKDIIYFDGINYPNTCSNCDNILGKTAVINEKFPGEIWCDLGCLAEWVSRFTLEITIQEEVEQ